MSKYGKPNKKGEKKANQEWPLVVYVWIVGLGLLSYVTARIALDGQPHPYHWLAGLVGGVVGCGIGWLWFRWKGDMV